MPSETRILAIDYGEKRIGLAVSDPFFLFATGIETIPNDIRLLDELRRLCEQYAIVKIVVGLPMTLRGTQSDATLAVEKFVERLRSGLMLPVDLWDERFTSKMASQTILDLGVGKMKRREKAKVDQLAAVHLLQSYLAAGKR